MGKLSLLPLIFLRKQLLLTATVSLLLPLGAAPADALVITEAMKATTIAEIFIESETMRVELEITPLPSPISSATPLKDATPKANSWPP